MENRLPIYYSGNTVEPPHPSDANRKRRRGIIAMPKHMQPVYVPRFSAKTCATSQCLWCGNAFGEFLTVCKFCSSCQFCGLTIPTRQTCHHCGNRPDDEIRKERNRRVVRGSKLPVDEQGT